MVGTRKPEQGLLMQYVCGFWLVNKKHCIINGHCVVCNYRESTSIKHVIKEREQDE